jgi:integrase
MNANFKKSFPFSIFKRADRSYYSVSFKDQNGKYLPPVSTRKKNKDDALQAAFKMLSEGIPQKEKTVTVRDLSLRDGARKIKSKEDADIVLSELQRLGMVKSYILSGTHKAAVFTEFLTTFWDWDNSPYIEEKLRQEHSIHKRHCQQQGNAIDMYWTDFFMGRYLGEITHDDISSFIKFMGTKALSNSRKNVVIKAGMKPLRYAFAKRWIEVDPTLGHLLFSEPKKKRHILTPVIASAIFRIEWTEERAKVANMLSAITGMRSGEIAALKFKDIGTDCLYVQSSWNYIDKDKTTKNNEARNVEIAFPFVIQKLIEVAKSNPWGYSPDSYVFWSEFHSDQPMQGYFFLNSLREALVKIGFEESDAKKYLFHGWRHFFTSYMVKKLEKRLLKTQTGHLTDIMIDHYSDHETVGDRELIQSKQREVFAGLIPEHIASFPLTSHV